MPDKTYEELQKDLKRLQTLEDMGRVFGTKGKDGGHDTSNSKKKKTYAEVRRDKKALAKLRGAKGLELRTGLAKKK